MISVSNYDRDSDSLIVSVIEDNEKVRNNFSFDNFVISLTDEGKIVSLEIRDFSVFAEEMGLNINELIPKLDNLTLVVKPKKELLYIGVGYKDDTKRRIPIMNIPIQSIKN